MANKLYEHMRSIANNGGNSDIEQAVDKYMEWRTSVFYTER